MIDGKDAVPSGEYLACSIHGFVTVKMNEDGALSNLATFQEELRKFFSMEDSKNVKYSMLFEACITCSTILCLDEVGALLLPNDTTDEAFNAYWLVYILFTNYFEIISIAIASLDVFLKKFVNDIVVNLWCSFGNCYLGYPTQLITLKISKQL